LVVIDGAHYQVHADAGGLVAAPAVGVPLLIGGNGTRLLQLGGQAADIVGLAGFSHNRDARRSDSRISTGPGCRTASR
jgi:alkanesulfonate monooxygenase SsuD/methylene tetrahydromethanopterin reductase-like flavin-dependent oxidoreductase (luciferase family)